MFCIDFRVPSFQLRSPTKFFRISRENLKPCKLHPEERAVVIRKQATWPIGERNPEDFRNKTSTNCSAQSRSRLTRSATTSPSCPDLFIGEAGRGDFSSLSSKSLIRKNMLPVHINLRRHASCTLLTSLELKFVPRLRLVKKGKSRKIRSIFQPRRSSHSFDILTVECLSKSKIVE